MAIVNNRLYQMAFALLKGMNRPIAERLLELFGDERSFFEASDYVISSMTGTKLRFAGSSERTQSLRNAEEELNYIDSKNIKFLYFTDENYPSRLSECEDSPLSLFHIGDLDFDNARCLSVVGTRHATRHGIDTTESIIGELSQKIDNLVIISGLAYGIDITAHRAALANDIPTIAVVAHGLNTIYPALHRNDAAKIVKKCGAIVTEYPHSSPIHKSNFLARNRIVAGLSDGVLVVESGDNGGALVTAKIAGAYNRDVMAIPGRPSDQYSKGCNSLIRNNMASLVTNADDIIRLLSWPAKEAENNVQPALEISLTDEEKLILDYIIANNEASINAMSVNLNIPVGRLLPALVNLEFNGLISAAPGARYIPK